MIGFVCSLWKKRGLLLLALILLCGCSSFSTSQASPTPTPGVRQASPTPTAVAQQVSPTPAAQQASPTPPAAQTAFASYVGKWQVHDELLSINANATGLLQWNAGPCSNSGQMCNGNAQLTFTENAGGSITGAIQSVSYSQWNGGPAPTGYQPSVDDPRAGESFQLQHSGTHLLYTTWVGAASSLNSNNRYWCDSYALGAGWQQCGA